MNILIGQEPIVRCTGRPIENWSLFHQSIRLWPVFWLVIYNIFSCSSKIPRGFLRR